MMREPSKAMGFACGGRGGGDRMIENCGPPSRMIASSVIRKESPFFLINMWEVEYPSKSGLTRRKVCFCPLCSGRSMKAAPQCGESLLSRWFCLHLGCFRGSISLYSHPPLPRPLPWGGYLSVHKVKRTHNCLGDKLNREALLLLNFPNHPLTHFLLKKKWGNKSFKNRSKKILKAFKCLKRHKRINSFTAKLCCFIDLNLLTTFRNNLDNLYIFSVIA